MTLPAPALFHSVRFIQSVAASLGDGARLGYDARQPCDPWPLRLDHPAPFQFRADNPLVAKFLLLLALGIVVYLIVSRVRRQGERPAVPRQDQSSGSSGKSAGEDMVRCAVCRVHLPRSESFTSKGEFFCTDEHRRLGAQGARKD
jgi:uncharacterized protein